MILIKILCYIQLRSDFMCPINVTLNDAFVQGTEIAKGSRCVLLKNTAIIILNN